MPQPHLDATATLKGKGSLPACDGSVKHCSLHTMSNTGSLPSSNGLLEGCSNHTMSNTALLHPQGMSATFAACQHPRIPIFHRLRIPTFRHSDITTSLHGRVLPFYSHNKCFTASQVVCGAHIPSHTQPLHSPALAWWAHVHTFIIFYAVDL